MNKSDIANMIYETLQSSRFEKWHDDKGNFGMHVRGDLDANGEAVSQEQIMQDINRLFKNVIDLGAK